MATEAPKVDREYAKIVNELQNLRSEQRNIANNISTIEMDLKEHKTVIDTLKTVNDDRKCYRLVGGVLCERTVADVLPQLTEAKDQLEKLFQSKKQQLTDKGMDIEKFRVQHNIKIKVQGDANDAESASTAESDEKRTILVSN